MSTEAGCRFGIDVEFGAVHDVMHVRGELDLQTVSIWQAALRELVAQGSDLVLDLAHVDFISAAGLRVIVDLAGQRASSDRTLVLRSVSARTARLLDVIGAGSTVRFEAEELPVLLGAEQRAWEQTAVAGSRESGQPSVIIRTDPGAVDAALQLITELAASTVDGADGVSVTLRRDGRMLTVAASNETVLRMDQHQYETGQGPCLAAAAEGRWFHIESLADEQRWEAFVPRARDEGIASVLSSPVMRGERSVGALNIYSNVERSFGPAEQELAALLASLASGIVTQTGSGLGESDRADRTTAALTARRTIARAEGMLMARRGLTGEQAARELHRVARQAGSTVLARAEAMTAGKELDFGQSE